MFVFVRRPKMGGECKLPKLFQPTIVVGANEISWANDIRNGGFAVTLSATIDGVTVTSPLTITEEMDGKTLIVTATAENFESATNEKELRYIGATTHVIGEFPEIADAGGTYRFRVAAPSDSYSRWTIDGVHVHNSANLPDFDPSDIRDYEVRSQGMFSFTATIKNDTSQPSGFPLRFAGTGYFVNGIKVANLVFTGRVEIYDAETEVRLIYRDYTDNVGLPIPMDTPLSRKTIVIKMNGTMTLQAV